MGTVRETLDAARKGLHTLEQRAHVSIPTPARTGNDFIFPFIEHGLTLTLSGVRDTTEGVFALVEVRSAGAGQAFWGRVNLLSSVGQKQVVAGIAKALPSDAQAAELVLGTFYAAVTAYCTREPATVLRAVSRREPPALIRKLLYRNQANAIFAPGDNLKSTLVDALAVAVGAGVSLPGGLDVVEQGVPMIADWESDEETHGYTCGAIAKGLRVALPTVHYRRFSHSLADEFGSLRRECVDKGVKVLFADSYGPAVQRNAEGKDSATDFWNLLRDLPGVTPAVVTHTNKAQAGDGVGRSSPYGSVYFENLARNVWEVRRSEGPDQDTVTLGLFQRKFNLGRHSPPFGLTFTFSPDMITIRSAELADAPDLVNRGDLSYRLLEYLRDGGQTTKSLAESAGTDEATARVTLRRLEKTGKVIALADRAGGRGKVQEWALRARQESP